MGAFKFRVALLCPCVLALGFIVGMKLSPELDHERRTFLNTYFFVEQSIQAEWLSDGLVYPEPDHLGVSTSGASARLALPVEGSGTADLEILIEYSINPKLGSRTVEIAINGEKVTEWFVQRGKRRIAKAVRVPSGLWRSGEPLSVTMRTKTDDHADLGMILHAVSFFEVS